MKIKEFYNSTAWKYCSKYVLLYYSNEDGYVQCSTSGIWLPCNSPKMHAGHYLKVNQHKSTAFEFKNIAPQCYQDNKFYSGKPEIMAKWIDKTHGTGTVDYLNIKKNNTCKLGKFELAYWKDHYKNLFNNLVIEKGFNPWKKIK